jgi:hypothetical protein
MEASLAEEEEAAKQQAAQQHGADRLGPLHEALGGSITYDKLHMFRAFASPRKG